MDGDRCALKMDIIDILGNGECAGFCDSVMTLNVLLVLFLCVLGDAFCGSVVLFCADINVRNSKVTLCGIIENEKALSVTS